jgi:undecaprenyl-diphosphatase
MMNETLLVEAVMAAFHLKSSALRTSRHLWMFGVAAMACGFLVTAVVYQGRSQVADEASFEFIRQFFGVTGIQPVWVTEAYRDLTALGSMSVLGLAVICTSAYLFALRRTRLGLLLIASSLLATAFSSALKMLVNRTRPVLEAGSSVPTFTASFPSGHALLSAAIILTIGGILASATEHRSGAYAIAILSVLLTLLVGLSRIVLGVHWPSDVLAGWLFGTAWACLTLAALRVLGRKQFAEF